MNITRGALNWHRWRGGQRSIGPAWPDVEVVSDNVFRINIGHIHSVNVLNPGSSGLGLWMDDRWEYDWPHPWRENYECN